MKKSILFLFSILLTANVFATTWYVKLNETAWADKPEAEVKTTFEEAFNAASANDEIWISSGVLEINAEISFSKHLKVYGSFAGDEESIEDRQKVEDGKPWEYVHTTYVQQKGTSLTRFMSVPSGQNVIIDGLYFRNFKLTSHAVCHIRQNTKIQNCVFAENSNKTGDVTSVSMYPGGHLLDSYFYKNVAEKVGAGVMANQLNQPVSIIGCTFEENVGEWGVAINVKMSGSAHDTDILAVISDNTVINNKGTSGTPSILDIRHAGCVVSNTLIANNDGLPLLLRTGEFSNGTIVNNRGIYGARVQTEDDFVTKLYNTVFWNNKKANDDPAVIHIFNEDDLAELSHNAFDAPTTGLTETATEANSILLEEDNIGDDDEKNYAGFANPYPTVGYVEDDLEGVRAADWQTVQGSALIDAGSDIYVPGNVELDLLGNNRFTDNVDIGAYENDKESFVSVRNPLDTDISCYYSNGTLYLKDIQLNTKVSIHTISGQVIATFSAKESLNVALPQSVYIVQTELSNHKILVQ